MTSLQIILLLDSFHSLFFFLDTTYETEVNDFFDLDRHVGVLSP